MNRIRGLSEEQTLRGQVVLITGASRGIGAATAKLFGAHGATVAVNYHQNEQKAKQIVQEIEALEGKALAIQAAIDDAQQVATMVTQVEEELGPIDTLVMNAQPHKLFAFAPFAEFDWEVFQEMTLGNMAGVYFPARAVIPSMIQRKRGNLIAVSSGASRLSLEGSVAQAAGKAGVDAMVRVLARELGPHGIRVNTIAPGWVETDATAGLEAGKLKAASETPLGARIAQPEDIAGAIYLLALGEAQFLTGTYITVNGGYSML
ncbi:MAG TPA: SDR family oxidoreductase [Ktedonobacteraceae bacterium]|nr:SDR family oxidoreductase [Ktedonobacteraceae bacterium]